MGSQLPLKAAQPPHAQFSDDVYCGQTAGWMKTPVGTKVPRPHCVRQGPRSPRERGTTAPSLFSAHVYCGVTAGWIKMPLDREVNLGPGDVVLDGVAAPPKRGTAPARPPPSFRTMSIVAKRLDG